MTLTQRKTPSPESGTPSRLCHRDGDVQDVQSGLTRNTHGAGVPFGPKFSAVPANWSFCQLFSLPPACGARRAPEAHFDCRRNGVVAPPSRMHRRFVDRGIHPGRGIRPTMRATGIEPARVSPREPKSRASASFATPALAVLDRLGRHWQVAPNTPTSRAILPVAFAGVPRTLTSSPPRSSETRHAKDRPRSLH